MQQSAALRSLLVGLAGTCQVAAFGTFSQRVAVRGEAATGTFDTDDYFCLNITKKTNIGDAWCGSLKTAVQCGYGMDSFRVSSAGKNKYDPCYWNPNFLNGDGTLGKCELTMQYYMCGPQCLPTGQDIGGTPTGGNTISCGGANYTVPTGQTVSTCKCVKKWVESVPPPGGKVYTECAIVTSVASSRRGRSLLTAAECESQNTEEAATQSGNYWMQRKYQCTASSTSAGGPLTCTCVWKTVILFENPNPITVTQPVTPGSTTTEEVTATDQDSTSAADQCKPGAGCCKEPEYDWGCRNTAYTCPTGGCTCSCCSPTTTPCSSATLPCSE